MAENLGGGLDAVQARKADIHEDNMGVRELADLDGVRAVFGLTHHAELLTVLENGFDAVPHDLVIVHQ